MINLYNYYIILPLFFWWLGPEGPSTYHYVVCLMSLDIKIVIMSTLSLACVSLSKGWTKVFFDVNNWMLSEVERVGDLIAKSWDEKEKS